MRMSDWSSDVCSSDLSGMASSMGAHAAICWNGSIQSARAVGAALPFLRHAERVTVLTADEADRRVPAAMLRSYLARHDIRARSEEHTSELQSLMRISYAVFCLKKKKTIEKKNKTDEQ